MAKKQTRRSISVSRTTYERLKAFCEANNISMSQLVETRVNDFLGSSPVPDQPPRPMVPTLTSIGAPRPAPAMPPRPERVSLASVTASSGSSSNGNGNGSTTASSTQVPMTSAAARFVVEPPPPIIKPKQETAAPKPAEKRPDQIFTF